MNALGSYEEEEISGSKEPGPREQTSVSQNQATGIGKIIIEDVVLFITLIPS
jgi:hypothetical protein